MGWGRNRTKAASLRSRRTRCCWQTAGRRKADSGRSARTPRPRPWPISRSDGRRPCCAMVMSRRPPLRSRCWAPGDDRRVVDKEVVFHAHVNGLVERLPVFAQQQEALVGARRPNSERYSARESSMQRVFRLPRPRRRRSSRLIFTAPHLCLRSSAMSSHAVAPGS